MLEMYPAKTVLLKYQMYNKGFKIVYSFLQKNINYILAGEEIGVPTGKNGKEMDGNLLSLLNLGNNNNYFYT